MASAWCRRRARRSAEIEAATWCGSTTTWPSDRRSPRSEQASGLQEVNVAVNQMDQVTQQNAAMVEETSAATQKLSSEAGGLFSMVSQFHLGEAGAAQGHTATVSATASKPPASRSIAKPARAASEIDRPRASPARAMTGAIAKALGIGGAATAAAAAPDADWEEF
jgi:methyl-accepting chemotaxis protein